MPMLWILGAAMAPDDLGALAPAEAKDDLKTVIGADLDYGKAYYGALHVGVDDEEDVFEPPSWLVVMSEQLTEMGIPNAIGTPTKDDDRWGRYKIWNKRLGELPEPARSIGEWLERRFEYIADFDEDDTDEIARHRRAAKQAARHLGFEHYTRVQSIGDGITRLFVIVKQPRDAYDKARQKWLSDAVHKRVFAQLSSRFR